MTDSKRDNSSLLPYFLFISAILVGALFANTESMMTKQLSGGLFLLLMGSPLLLWAKEEITAGAIRGKRRPITIAEYPLLFWAMVAVKRLLPGVVLVTAGLYELAFGGLTN